VDISVQAEVEISLVTNPGIGYSWSVAEIDSAKLHQVDKSAFKAKSDQHGDLGQQIFRFRPITAGSVMLKLIYQRPWEKAVDPADTFEVTLHVIDGQ
jgi:predicted secreted protein